MSIRSSVVVLGGTRPPSRRGGDRRGWNVEGWYIPPTSPTPPVFYGPKEDDGNRWWVVQCQYPGGFTADLKAVYCRKANPEFLLAGPFGAEGAQEWIGENWRRYEDPLREIFNELIKL